MEESTETSVETKLVPSQVVLPIATPLAGGKLIKRIYRLVKKGKPPAMCDHRYASMVVVVSLVLLACLVGWLVG